MSYKKYVYRRREDGVYEVGTTSLRIQEINRTGIKDWCDSRVCETWSEENAIEIVNAFGDVCKMKGVLLMIKEELCFGGDWKNAEMQIDDVLKNN